MKYWLHSGRGGGGGEERERERDGNKRIRLECTSKNIERNIMARRVDGVELFCSQPTCVSVRG